jgi:phosphoribosylaminoimidazole (AIR) synthetase
MSVIGRVRAFFGNLWSNILQPDVQTAEQVAEGFFSAAISDAATQLGAVGLKIVTDGVTAKLAAATAAITADLSTAGIQAAAHVVNAAIEGAVSQLNSNNKAVTTPTSSDAVPEAAPDSPPSQAG